ncbi:phenylacetate-CoA oxygenase subunit PaaJ [Pseudonocardiaceae bacterium YIM PH 21723]|nr:phenylacetate-CoA oxygenase subunit PaaJ [Pseudonocardiaceae bacterium YIM PH 21723]
MMGAREIAEQVLDPELPVLTLAELGVLRDVHVEPDGSVLVTITPTYSGCPAVDVMRAQLRNRLQDAGYAQVNVRSVLSPAWTTDWITDEGRRKLATAGIAPPNRVGPRVAGPIPLNLEPPSATVPCPRCGSRNTELLSRFGATACKALYRCHGCAEPFEHFKEL